MMGNEPASDVPAGAPVDARSLRAAPRIARTRTGGALRPIGGRPILWQWWLLAGVLSLALWAGIIAFVA